MIISIMKKSNLRKSPLKISKYVQMIVPSLFPQNSSLSGKALNLSGVELPVENIHGTPLSSVDTQGGEALKNDSFTRIQCQYNSITATV